MDQARLREVSRLEFRLPAPFLTQLRQIELHLVESELPRPVRELRTNSLKTWREAREAALFCHGLGQRLDTTVLFAREEARDHDFIAASVISGVRHVVPVQLKEVVPADLNPSASMQRVLDSLAKYTDSADLTVAIYLNQCGRFDPANVRVNPLSIGSLWIFGAISEDLSEWAIWGDFLQRPFGTRFAYPT
jgi:hypothetical protein